MSQHRGFTLIELLMVVAIIGVLSTIVLGAMQDARLKAADATVRQEANQLRNLLEQERTNSGTYDAIKNGGDGSAAGGWISVNGACDVGAPNFSGQFATQAMQVCRKLVAAASVGGRCGTSCVYFQTTSPNSATTYSIMAYLPYESKKATEGGSPYLQYLCVGSSGNQSIGLADGPSWGEYGCQNNP